MYSYLRLKYSISQVSVNDSGVIQHVDYTLYEDNGYKVNETLFQLGVEIYYNVYDSSRWSFKGYNVLTDTPKNTWCRAPGTKKVILINNKTVAIIYSIDMINFSNNISITFQEHWKLWLWRNLC